MPSFSNKAVREFVSRSKAVAKNLLIMYHRSHTNGLNGAQIEANKLISTS